MLTESFVDAPGVDIVWMANSHTLVEQEENEPEWPSLVFGPIDSNHRRPPETGGIGGVIDKIPIRRSIKLLKSTHRYSRLLDDSCVNLSRAR